MWAWLNNNSAAIQLFLNLGLLLVWLFYLQLFLFSFRRRRRCKILINVSGERALAARCLICNMSEEPVYVMSVIATVQTRESTWRSSITEYELDDNRSPPHDAQEMTRQGPLRMGDCRDIGSYAQLIDRARHAHGEWESTDRLVQEHWPIELKLTVIAVYGSEDLPVAAEREFELHLDGARTTVKPLTISTSQIRGKRARQNLHQHLEEYI